MGNGGQLTQLKARGVVYVLVSSKASSSMIRRIWTSHTQGALENQMSRVLIDACLLSERTGRPVSIHT